jgi:hypothetical protein
LRLQFDACHVIICSALTACQWTLLACDAYSGERLVSNVAGLIFQPPSLFVIVMISTVIIAAAL